MGQMIPDLTSAAAMESKPSNGAKKAQFQHQQQHQRQQSQPQPQDAAAKSFTESVIGATGPNANPRLAQIMPSLVRHLHAFAREVNLTVAEWVAAVDFINECGQMSTDRRNETQLLCDIFGLESLVDEITSTLLATSTAETPSSILGPFYRHDAPLLPNGSSIVQNLSPSVPWYDQALADSAFLTGRVLASSGMPIKGATVDVWHAAPNGLYEQQDTDQPEMNFRGRFETDAEGGYALYALRPVAYPIPDDGPAGRLLGMLDRHPYRPGHIHFIVSAPGFRSLTTQLYDDRDEYVTNDAVFAVKDELVVKFVPRKDDPKARWSLDYDFVLGRV